MVVVGRGVNVPLTMTAPILVLGFVTDPIRKHRGCVGLIGVEKNPPYISIMGQLRTQKLIYFIDDLPTLI